MLPEMTVDQIESEGGWSAATSSSKSSMIVLHGAMQDVLHPVMVCRTINVLHDQEGYGERICLPLIASYCCFIAERRNILCMKPRMSVNKSCRKSMSKVEDE